jgi:hypothetical protein
MPALTTPLLCHTCVVPFPSQVADPTEEQVHALHCRYFTALHELFEEHKDRLGYGKYKMHLSGMEGQAPVSEADWAKLRAAAEDADEAEDAEGRRSRLRTMSESVTETPKMKERFEMVWASAFFVLSFTAVAIRAVPVLAAAAGN